MQSPSGGLCGARTEPFDAAQGPRGREDEDGSLPTSSQLARQYGRYGYRKPPGCCDDSGLLVDDKRVERIWRREGLKVPHKIQSTAGYGLRTDHASGCGPSTAITSGATTLSKTAPTMAEISHAQRHR